MVYNKIKLYKKVVNGKILVILFIVRYFFFIKISY